MSARIELGCALVALVAWSSCDVADGAPDLPGRAALHAAADRCLRRHAGTLSRLQHDALIDRYRRWRAAYEATAVDLAHPWSPYAVLAADLLATLDEALESTRAGQAARRARGKPVSAEGRARLAELEALHEALESYDRELHRAIGHDRSTREATFYGDVLHRQLAQGAA